MPVGQIDDDIDTESPPIRTSDSEAKVSSCGVDPLQVIGYCIEWTTITTTNQVCTCLHVDTCTYTMLAPREFSISTVLPLSVSRPSSLHSSILTLSFFADSFPPSSLVRCFARCSLFRPSVRSFFCGLSACLPACLPACHALIVLVKRKSPKAERDRETDGRPALAVSSVGALGMEIRNYSSTHLEFVELLEDGETRRTSCLDS